jgi:hypothetical protein
VASLGFSNVATVVEGRRVFVTFENTRYRDLRRGLREVAAELLPSLGPAGELVLAPTLDGVPLGTATFRAGISVSSGPVGSAVPRPAPRTSLDLKGLPAQLFSTPRASASFGRVDVVVHPWLEARLGQGANAGSRLGLAPEVRIPLRKGATLKAQLLFTIHDGMVTGESRLRPGLVVLKQRMRLPQRTFLTITAGSFIPDRYGIDAEVQFYSRQGRWSWGATGAMTGSVSYGLRDWYYKAPSQPTVMVNAAVLHRERGLFARATAGIVSDQRVLRVDLRRQFGETDLGFFAVVGEKSENAGFSVRVPLFTRAYVRPGPIRLRPSEAAKWEYFYHDFPTGTSAYRVGDTMDEVLRWLVPAGEVYLDRSMSR